MVVRSCRKDRHSQLFRHLRATRRLQLRLDVFQVPANGVDGDPKGRGDLRIGPALDETVRNVDFTGREVELVGEVRRGRESRSANSPSFAGSRRGGIAGFRRLKPGLLRPSVVRFLCCCAGMMSVLG